MPQFRHRRARALAVGALALPLLFAGCGDDDGGDGVAVDGAWARTSPMMADAGAAYMDLTSDTDTEIIGVSVDAEVAGTAELHETVMTDGEMTDGEMTDDEMTDDEMTDGETDMGGAMTMQEVGSIALPAGATVSLEPGGYHVMLLDLVEPLELGDTFDVTLQLADGEELVVEVEVRDEAP